MDTNGCDVKYKYKTHSVTLENQLPPSDVLLFDMVEHARHSTLATYMLSSANRIDSNPASPL